MKPLMILILSLIALLQYPLWFGKASWSEVSRMGQIVKEKRKMNHNLQEQNLRLSAEVNDLKNGYEAIEERARNELGMIKRNEVFFQILRSSE